MLQKCDRVLFAITDIFIPSLSLFFCFFCNLPSAGICGVSRRIHCSGLGIQEDSDKATAAQAGGEKEELCAQAVQEERRGKERYEGREREKLTCFLYLTCLADMLSDSEVRGDDCIDGFYSLVISEKETESRLKQQKLVMQKSTINHHIQFVLNESTKHC